MVYISTRNLMALACLSLPIIARAVSPPPASSPSAETELICPTDNAAECYPRLFQPTKDFQIIKEGQDIPPGLHVRMDVYSGKKEARLNIPMDGEDSTSVIDVPLEQAMVVVDQPEEEVIQEKPTLRDQVPQKPPPYDPVGKVQPPSPDSEGAGTDSQTFNQAIRAIKSGVGNLTSSLEDLAELSHDIYYGSELAKDSVLVEKLACLMIEPNSAGPDHQAARVLGSAIQNNPTAMKEINKAWKEIMYPSCSGTKEDLINRLRSIYTATPHDNPATLKARVYMLSGLLKDNTIRDDFLANGGMELLSLIYSIDGAESKGVRVKVAQLVMDNFLDESMGAELGVWPKKPLLEDKVCQSQDRMLEDGCWEYHVGRHGGGSWSKEFLKALRAQRAPPADSVQDREL